MMLRTLFDKAVGKLAGKPVVGSNVGLDGNRFELVHIQELELGSKQVLELGSKRALELDSKRVLGSTRGAVEGTLACSMFERVGKPACNKSEQAHSNHFFCRTND